MKRLAAGLLIAWLSGCTVYRMPPSSRPAQVWRFGCCIDRECDHITTTVDMGGGWGMSVDGRDADGNVLWHVSRVERLARIR